MPSPKLKEKTKSKFSSRTTDAALQKGVNLGDVMRLAQRSMAEKVADTILQLALR